MTKTLAPLLNHMSSVALFTNSIRQTGLGQHAGGWSAPVNRGIGADAGQCNSKQPVMPIYGQPGRIGGAGAEHGGRTP